jgi:hypothetical protein
MVRNTDHDVDGEPGDDHGGVQQEDSQHRAGR